MSSEKKHYWLVYYSHKDKGVHTDGHVVMWSDNAYFNQACISLAQKDIPKGALIVSVSYLGEMTEEEWRGG